MARFDVHRLADGQFVLDCQSNFLSEIATRFVVPLVSRAQAPPPNSRLNPAFDVAGEELMMLTQFAGAIRTAELRHHVTSLQHEDLRIIAAIDVLTGSG